MKDFETEIGPKLPDTSHAESPSRALDLGRSVLDLSHTDVATAHVTPYQGPEVEIVLQPSLSKDDFKKFAKQIDKEPELAGLAWNMLRKLYAMKHPPKAMLEKSWCNPSLYSYVPLVYDEVPVQNERGYFNMDEFSGLHVDSLELLMDYYYRALDRNASNSSMIRTRKRVFGLNIGETTIHFLDSIVAATASQRDVTSEESSSL